MISKFSAMYVGNIGLEDIGRDGTPADDRRYPNERLVEALYNSEALAEHMDGLGYHALWGAEHHFQREGYECIPNLILWAVHLAGRTRNLKFGCAFNVIPTWHPIRLAEDFAMADVLTRGPVVFEAYRDEAAKAGRQLELGENLGLGLAVYIADSKREAMERVRPYHDERYKWFAKFGLVRYVDEQGRMWGTPGAPARLPTIEDGVDQRAWPCGPPDEIAAQLKLYQDEYPGLDQVVLHLPEGMPPEEFRHQLSLFAEHVIPRFQPAAVAAPAG